MPDRKKVIKGLECCMKWTGEPDTATCHCSDCSYTNMDILGQRCLIDLINDALELLQSQPQIVRCKDCKFWYKDECSHLCKITGDLHPANWFCADGKKDGDGE